MLTDLLGTGTRYIEPGSPWENGYCESFNGRLQDEAANRVIGIGERPPVLPCHTTISGSAYGGSVSWALAGRRFDASFRHRNFAARQVSVSASPSSEPTKLSRS